MTPHGHNFSVEITVRGEVDPETGFVVDLPALDRLLREEVVEPLDQQDLNRAILEVRDGTMTPSTEALALWLWGRLRDRIPGAARLHRVRVAESDSLASEVSE
jgi:6-pyruvoyltetrahydropterin/6-carboxytetrahydropterin synthase